MEDDTDNPRQSSNSAAIAAVMLLPLFYALSIGPAALYLRLHHGSQALEEAVVKFYRPILWLYGHTSLKQPIESYLDWWRSWA